MARSSGSALALRRDDLWGLSLLVVHPDHQSRGVGRLLLDAALGYAEGVATAVILSSPDARAMRRYAAAGFALFPQVFARGTADRTRVPAPPRGLRAGSTADADLADDVDRRVRGARRGPDHGVLTAGCSMHVVADGERRGYAYVRPDGRVAAVAATDDATAAALLWACLVDGSLPAPERTVSHITGEQHWAVRVAVDAGLRLTPGGPVFWRGRTPPPAYLPDGAFL